MNRHSLTVNGKNQDITRKDLEVVAQQNDIHDYKFKAYALYFKIYEHLIDTIESDFVKI